MARRDPVRRLNSVDLPTFGRPTMAMSGDCFFLLKVEDELRGPCRYYRDSVPSSSHPVSPPETRPAGFSLYQFFAPCGVLSKTHPAYEFRRGQLQMAQACDEPIDDKRHL